MEEHATTTQFLSKAINKMLFTYEEAGKNTYLFVCENETPEEEENEPEESKEPEEAEANEEDEEEEPEQKRIEL